MCHRTFDAEFGDRRLELPSDQGIVRRSLFFRQRYNRHRYALNRSYSCRDRLLLLPCKLVHRCPLPSGHAMSDNVPDGDQQQQSLHTEMKERAELISVVLTTVLEEAGHASAVEQARKLFAHTTPAQMEQMK